MIEKIKVFCQNNEKNIILSASVILISMISFGAGRLSTPTIQKIPISFEKTPNQASISNVTGNENKNQADLAKTNCLIVGNKNSKKYHYPKCIGAKNTSENNKICFSSKEEAISKGYAKASNCPGL